MEPIARQQEEEIRDEVQARQMLIFGVQGRYAGVLTYIFGRW